MLITWKMLVLNYTNILHHKMS